MTPDFELQTAETIRTLQVWCAVLSTALCLVLVVAILGFANSTSATDAVSRTALQVQAGLKAQTSNRALNVGAWCQGINQGRDYDRAFVQRVTHGHVQYALSDLPCAALELRTLASTKSH